MVDLEGIMLSEISQTEKIQIAYDSIYIWNLENKQNRSRLIDTENKLMVARWERGWGLGGNGEGIKYKVVLTK